MTTTQDEMEHLRAPAREHIKVKLYAVGRARCPQCSDRWPWPDGAPTPAELLLMRSSVVCPSCLAIVPLEPEPCDQRWWSYVSTPPSAAPVKAQISTPGVSRSAAQRVTTVTPPSPATEPRESEREFAKRVFS